MDYTSLQGVAMKSPFDVKEGLDFSGRLVSVFHPESYRNKFCPNQKKWVECVNIIGYDFDFLVLSIKTKDNPKLVHCITDVDSLNTLDVDLNELVGQDIDVHRLAAPQGWDILVLPAGWPIPEFI